MWNNIYKGLSMSDKSMTDRISLLFFIFYLCFYRPKDNLMYIKCLQHIYEYRFTISVNDNEFIRLRKILFIVDGQALQEDFELDIGGLVKSSY